MRLYYPRSFLKLLAVGFALIAVPLLVALVTNAVSVDRLADRSQNAVYQAVQATQGSRRIAELLAALERTARQIVILGDRSLFDAYEAIRARFARAVADFERLPLDAEQRAAVAEIVRGEAAIHAVLARADPRGAEVKRAVEGFPALSARADEVVARANALIAREIEALRETADRARRLTLWQLLAIVPVVLFLAVGFTVLLARPIRQIDLAIRRLGRGAFGSPVMVSGPQDLVYLGERLEWLRQQLLELEEQKNRFLRHVSHELKTPLTALREGAELLCDEVAGKLSPEQREIAEILRHNSIELQKLIEDLLSYGATRFRQVKLELEPVRVPEVIRRVAEDQRLALRARELRLEIEAEDVVVTADREKLRVMLDNLLSNAVKFSPAGGTIRVATRTDGAEVALEVSDEGPGIAPHERSRVFEPFYRGAAPAAGPVRGTGVGLSVVKEYAAAHGGRVEVLDAARGARFRVWLPLSPREAGT
jgi:two-component system sensor histidine kinase GlrK